MFVRDMYNRNKTVTAEFRNVTTTVINGVVTKTYSTNADLSVEALFWVGSAADKVVSEKLRADIAGVVVMDYSDYTTTINENAKVTINSKDYSVIYVDNIAEQNEVIQIPVKRFS
ncbi:MAG: hypothetical protein PVF17_00730 [Ignavibacteria bacterium]|jgi:hypothetical protein